MCFVILKNNDLASSQQLPVRDLTCIHFVCRSSWSSHKVEDPECEEGHCDFDVEGSKERRWFTCHPLQRRSALLGCQRHPEGVLEEVTLQPTALHWSTWFLVTETQFGNWVRPCPNYIILYFGSGFNDLRIHVGSGSVPNVLDPICILVLWPQNINQYINLKVKTEKILYENFVYFWMQTNSFSPVNWVRAGFCEHRDFLFLSFTSNTVWVSVLRRVGCYLQLNHLCCFLQV